MVEVAANQQIRALSVPVFESAIVNIRVVDPQGALRRESRDYRPPLVVFRIIDQFGSLWIPSLVSDAGGTRQYALAVPRGRRFRLESQSPDVVLQRAGGAVLNRLGESDSFDVTAVSQHAFVFNVTGRR
jgi:hypothetical protein